ncbi:CHAD domain-containing protein [Phreatobacter aquaticus]|uniref:CHAD domain-containing protein n=1 Tax=Phreatobacter aquaticus TaxID=2570229 RepID=A0A4D7QIY0_9HYPH|nr:CHAD domain-containing protein [Phreatobacter aquaticus]QCK85384.1 CHAD domain-containing protein [Phreatobacter aquaticus]
MKPVARPGDLAAAAAAHAREAGRLMAAPKDPVTAVHQARRHIKRARSLLRALKPLAESKAGLENGRLRAVAHALAPLRDAHAMQIAAETIGAARPALPEAAVAVDLPSLARALARQAKSIAGLAAADAPKHFLARAVARFYGRARKAFRAYLAEPESERLHEARKRIKDCLHLVEALGVLRPKGSDPRPKRLAMLGDLLGELRDLDLLAARLGRAGKPSSAKRVRIDARRSRLERQISRAGARAFARPRRDILVDWRRS